MNELKRARLGAVLGMTALASWGGALAAAEAPHEISYRDGRGLVVIPTSSQSRPEDAGVRAHTNFRLFFANGAIAPSTSPPAGFNTPAALACVYGLVTPVTGCNPATVTKVPTGGSKVVVIVDAYDDPTATNDLTVFSKQFGLPAITSSNFEVVYATGSKPPQDSTGGWEFEESLDIEMAHAMAPDAKVILVEAASSSTTDLFTAEAVAANLAVAAGGGEVSNSWGTSEFSGETSYESNFVANNVVFFASTGDSPGTIFPSVLQNVVAAGGTTINRTSGNFDNQETWARAGGGRSSGVTIPIYQSDVAAVKKIVKKKRGVPDLSFVANPSTGVVIYDTTAYNGTVLDWTVVGGTSVSSPALAAIVNNAGKFAASSAAELATIYGSYTNTADFTDITVGTCGTGGKLKAKTGYDLCTGVGVPNGYGGK